MHTKQKGTIGHIAVALHLAKLNWHVFTEIGDLSKIDLIAVKGDKTVRIQVKSVSARGGVVVASSKKSGPGYEFRYSTSDIDCFAIHCIDNGWIAFVSANELCSDGGQIHLRIDETKNKQTVGVKWFIDYLDFEGLFKPL